MDAMGCNQTVIKAIKKGGGNYVLPVKENQKKLLAVINEEIKNWQRTKNGMALTARRHCTKSMAV